MSRFVRRDFLRITVVSAFAAAAPNLACSSDDEPPPAASDDPEDTLRVFPQGVASGDPSPNGVLLWTRVQPESPADVDVHYEIAMDQAFQQIVARGRDKAAVDSDHTLRLKVTNLSPYTTYYYRFTALNVRSDIGRTKTAPSADQGVPVRFAFASCQDFVGRYYHAWKALAEQAEAVDFVIFLGDYVYETDGDPSFQTPDEERKIVLPDGLATGETTRAARTLADYRALYKQYRSDPNLKRAHQLFPFVTIWDDHEFGNDCWQDHTTHFAEKEGPEQVPEQRLAADRAWYEYQAADVIFNASAEYPEHITIYRKLRYGKHVELFLTDQRYYRDDHVIPEGPTDIDVLKISENSDIGSRIFVLKNGFDPKEASKSPTMLGVAQKQWLIDGITQSSATWKVWGSETQLSQMLADLRSLDVAEFLKQKFYLTVDQWDGYRSERAEILNALSGVDNILVVTGDIHAFYASELHVNFDEPGPKPVAVEYVTAGISSFAVAPAAESVIGGNPTLSQLGLLELIPRFDELLQEGSPHYKYANSSSNGIGICNVTAEAAEVSFLMITDENVRAAAYTAPSKVVRLRTLAGTNRVEVLEA